jgi:MFS family permease
LVGTLLTLGCCVADSFAAYYVLRALMGFTFTAGQTVGLAFIQDIFFFHEQARKIGLWAWIHLMAPYSSPLLGNFIIEGTGNWRNVFWVVFAVAVWDLVLVRICIQETWYRRDMIEVNQSLRPNRFRQLLGIWQVQNHDKYFLTLKASCLRLTRVLFKPIMLPIMFY